MTKIKETKTLRYTVICISLLQMGMVGLSPVISSITTAFPGTSEIAAQMAATFLNLLLVITALLSGGISRFIGRRKMVIIGMGLFVLVAICGPFLTIGLWTVYCWSGLLGIGTGLFVPAASSIIADYFEGRDRSSLAGMQTAAVNIGGVLLSLISGILASWRWNNAYFVFLFAVPVLLMCFKNLPREEKRINSQVKKKGSVRIPIAAWTCTLQAIIFGIVYFTFSTNASLLLAEQGLGGTSMAGALTACFMMGGGICGLLYQRLNAVFKNKTAIVAFVIVSVSFYCIYFFKGLVPLFIAAFVGGGSLSLIFPFLLITVSEHVTPETSVISTSLVASVGPNLGSFISPAIITNLSAITGDTTVRYRFFTAATIAVAVTVTLLIISTVRLKNIHKQYDSKG